ncbi:hypothetical protein CXB51_024639 [Gossypium anomalum]|uniref:RNA-directed DNA polymerase n=1 Tax=Gossypium anomalum TaxID=47600 RepID=A0A8J5YA16_9ROSI|nr:hypothetical protein CXB51_024639 [Gossypium anomalum]
MAVEGESTRMQKELGLLQRELTQLQVEFAQLDARIDARLKDFQEGIKSEVRSEVRSELRSELNSLFEQYFGQNPPITVAGVATGKGKGILGSPLGFSAREHLLVSPISDLVHSNMSSRKGTLDVRNSSFRVDCPHFDGGNFRGWWSKLEQYFKAEGIGEQDRVRVVMLHLDGKALDWHHFFVHRHGGLHQLPWEMYARGIRERFGSESFLDPMTELVTLKQQGSVDQFHDGFLSLLNQLNLPETYALSIFISNLKPEIGQYLRLFKPQTLVEGYNLARQVKNIVFGAVKKGIVTGTENWRIEGRKAFVFGVAQNIHLVTNVLSLNCFSLSLSRVGNKIPGSPVLSLHALQGLQGCNTMLFSAVIGHTAMVVLVDSGSMHNFIDFKVAKRLQLAIEPRSTLRVMVANGVRLSTQGLCRDVSWEAQGYKFFTDFLVLSVKGFDLVLGTQWLLSLGPIVWDFSNLTMQFQHMGLNCILHGILPSSLQIVSSHQLSKCLNLVGNGPCPMLLAFCDQTAITLQPVQLPPELQGLLDDFEDVFQTPTGLPPPRLQDHRIPLTDETKVVKVRPYRYPAVQKTEIEKLVQEMLQTGIIRDSNSPFASPVMMVKKNDGSWRLCIDYRQLNQLTITDRFPILVIEELLDELGQAHFFSKLDLRSGYHQIRSRNRTYTKLLLRLMTAIMKKWANHLIHLQEVLQVLRSHQLYAKRSKCIFGATQVEYLGHVISQGVVSMDRAKMAAVLDWFPPKSVKELRGFLGLSEYYSRFIKRYGLLAKPLTTLLKKDTAFDQLKTAVCQAPVLVLPNFQEPFCIETDDSGQGVGVVLQQNGRPVAYFSKALGVKYQALSIYDKKMLAILLAVKKWHFYLVGRHFFIKTDHQSLKFLSEQQAITPFQQKWVAKMLGYDYSISYRKGAQNTVADVLSRRVPNHTYHLLQCEGSVETSWSDLWTRIVASYAADKKLSQLCQDAQKQPQLHPKYSWHGTFLRRLGKIVVGNDLQLHKHIFSLFHDGALGGHSGVHATRHRISNLLYWKGLTTDVKHWVRECVICQCCKGDNFASPSLLQPLPIPDHAWAVISMDFIEGLPLSQGKSTIFVVIDRLTKYGHFLALVHPFTALTIA